MCQLLPDVRSSDAVKYQHKLSAARALSWSLLYVPVLGKNGSSVSWRLIYNKGAFVPATDQEFSWTMTFDGSDPLPVKQWFCFKFLCHSCSPQNQCDLSLPRPTERSHETRLKTWLHRVEGVLFLAKCKVIVYAWTVGQRGNWFVVWEEPRRWNNVGVV